MKKTCNKCEVELPLVYFHKQKAGKFGRRGRCKSCTKAYSKMRYKENSKSIKEYSTNYRAINPEYQKEYYENNKGGILKRVQEYYKENKSKIQARNKKWREDTAETRREKSAVYREDNKNKIREYYQENKHYFLQRNKYRKAAKLKATPRWLTEEHIKQMNQFYFFRGMVSGVVGKDYHVDHIVPLQGKNVCGLHVPWNLQILPAKENLSKGNSYNDW